jgi:shikimate dehydrogenase
MVNLTTGKTKLFGIFGFPIGHTLSPVMHNAAFCSLGLPYQYLPFEVHPDRLHEAVSGISALGIQGANVTRPHKETIIPYLSRLTRNAQKMGAVNTVEVVRNQLVGHNTDGEGFLQSLQEAKVDPAGYHVILLGAGGATRAVAVSLLQKKIATLTIMARSSGRGNALVNDLSLLSNHKIKITLHPFESKPVFLNEPVLLINTTPLGMKTGDPLPYSPTAFGPLWVAADLIYTPYKTPLLLAAEKMGLKIVPGLGMLLYQAALAFEIWTKQKAPIGVMKKALQKALQDQK